MKIYLLIALLPILTIQWWDVGHMLTARIAEYRLSQLNPYAWIKFQALVTSINNMVDQRTRTFAEAACWPDDLKERKYNMELWNSWHFINKPIVSDGVFPVINFTDVTVNSVNVIKNSVNALSANINQTTAERALFARYLVHVIGDIHQPLHSVALFNETYPSGDRGGNSLKIKLLDNTDQNLHSFWDSGAFRIQNDSWFLVRPLDLKNTTALKDVALSYINQFGKEVQGLAENLDPVVWAKQSLDISRNTTYPHMYESNQVNQQYSDLTYRVAKKRVTLAGYRIANMVIKIYENSTIQSDKLSSQEIWQKLNKQEIKSYNDE